MNYFNYLAAFALGKINFIEPDLTAFLSEGNLNHESLPDINSNKSTYNDVINDNEPKSSHVNQNPAAPDASYSNNPDLFKNVNDHIQPEHNSSQLSDQPILLKPYIHQSKKIIEQMRHTEIVEREKDSVLRIDLNNNPVNGKSINLSPGDLKDKIPKHTTLYSLENEKAADILPAINITIGKIEVKAGHPEKRTQVIHKEQKPQITLSEYLKSFNKGRQ